MPKSAYRPQDYLMAESICDSLLRNRTIDFQLNADQMDRPKAEKHFKEREALIIVKSLLLDEGQRLL